MTLELLKTVHHHRFPGRRFGTDIGLVVLFGSAMVLYLQGKKVRASALSRYLQMPNETVRRHLKELVALGMLELEGHTFRPTAKSARAFDADRLFRLIKEAAKAL
jgi:DNA-binding IclR family transcriptional regulator